MKTLPQNAITDANGVAGWQRWVLEGDDLEAFSKLILLFFSSGLEPNWTHKLMPRETWRTLQISHGAFYRHLELIKESGYIAQLGEHEYESGGKWYFAPVFCLTGPW